MVGQNKMPCGVRCEQEVGLKRTRFIPLYCGSLETGVRNRKYTVPKSSPRTIDRKLRDHCAHALTPSAGIFIREMVYLSDFIKDKNIFNS